ncbi:MAG: hypothetical protein K9K36_16580 [Desulfarculaceae bacterium]|nr:hypothetical protein [Desulfarculaceae bacterium]MCF8066865.1 hypothetical protein [Desulfarculaceae bacterium]MCF8124509.1 hypothetical protein [Desulfarculaceae bacterium]
MDPIEGQDPCPLAEVELWPGNHDAWEAYGWIQNVTQPPENRLDGVGNGMGFSLRSEPGLRPPLLDLAGVIRVLQWLDLDPGPEGDREGLMTKLLIIHSARQEADMESRQARQ